MANHVRKQVRDAFYNALLNQLPSTQDRVYQGRATAIDERLMPALIVGTSGERVSLTDPEQRQPAERLQERVVSVQVAIGVSEENEAAAQDRIDQIALEVELAIFADPTLGGISENTEIRETRLNDFGSGERGVFAQLDLIFDATVFVTEGDPSDVLQQNQ